MVKVDSKKLKSIWEQNRQTIVIVTVALLLTIALLAVRAGAPFAGFESEGASLSGNVAVKNDSNASDGKYVEFMAGSGEEAGTVPGRIAASADGNWHDRDDILASAISIAILARSGNAHKLVYYGHSDHIWESDTQREEEMRISSEGTAELYSGFDMGAFYNAKRQTDTAINALAAEIDKSSPSNPLWIIGAGPMHIIGEAITKSDASKRQYATVISHHWWNNQHADKEHGGGWHFDDFDSLGINTYQISDQNQVAWNKPYSDYYWLRDSSDTELRWLWDRGQVAGKSTFDGSDAGMFYWLVTGGVNGGSQNATVQQAKAILTNGLN